MKTNKFQVLALVAAALFSQLSFAASEPLSRVVAHLKAVAKLSAPADVNAHVSATAIAMYKEGKITAPVAVIAVADLLGEKSPAVSSTITGLVKAGANPSLVVVASERTGMAKQDVFVAVLEGGVDPTSLTSSTAAGIQRPASTSPASHK